MELLKSANRYLYDREVAKHIDAYLREEMFDTSDLFVPITKKSDTSVILFEYAVDAKTKYKAFKFEAKFTYTPDDSGLEKAGKAIKGLLGKISKSKKKDKKRKENKKNKSQDEKKNPKAVYYGEDGFEEKDVTVDVDYYFITPEGKKVNSGKESYTSLTDFEAKIDDLMYDVIDSFEVYSTNNAKNIAKQVEDELREAAAEGTIDTELESTELKDHMALIKDLISANPAVGKKLWEELQKMLKSAEGAETEEDLTGLGID